jgi:hypothetical protein
VGSFVMSDIKKAREIVEDVMGYMALAGERDIAAKLKEGLALMVRKPYARPRAMGTRTIMSNKIARRLIRDAKANPGTPLDEISAKYGVAGGRVTEALQGKQWRA